MSIVEDVRDVCQYSETHRAAYIYYSKFSFFLQNVALSGLYLELCVEIIKIFRMNSLYFRITSLSNLDRNTFFVFRLLE